MKLNGIDLTDGHVKVLRHAMFVELRGCMADVGYARTKTVDDYCRQKLRDCEDLLRIITDEQE